MLNAASDGDLGGSSLSRRIVPCLDVRDGRVVKGVRFRDHVDMGDIVELALRYRDDGADELVFYDITASPQGRSVDREWVERVSRAIDIPFCVAGGIRDIADIVAADGVGCSGAVLGKALIEGRFQLTDALKQVRRC